MERQDTRKGNMEEVEDVTAEEMEELAKEMPTITQEEEELVHE